MSFIANVATQRSASARNRFSLLLLEAGERYVEDFSVVYCPAAVTEADSMAHIQHGRLKICTRSIIFDPQDTTEPMLKLPFSHCSYVGRWEGLLTSKLATLGDIVVVQSAQVVEMRENNEIAPYTFRKKEKGTEFKFALRYVNMKEVLPVLISLYEAHALSSIQRDLRIQSIIKAKHDGIKFDTNWLDDLFEKIIMNTLCERVTPLVSNSGRVILTTTRLYFQPLNNVNPNPVDKWRLSCVRRIIPRRYQLREVGCEVFLAEGASIYLTFPQTHERNEFCNAMCKQPAVCLEESNTRNMTFKWENRQISNYDYLLYLNSMADRSYNDLTQYPVFPWVLSDYTSSVLNLKDPHVYRDLSKPVGALNAERLATLRERYNEMPEPRFLYGTHYSSPGYVLFYLARAVPEYVLCMQDGKFDSPDRMFNSVSSVWENVLTSVADVKELIPEFFESPGSFLCNELDLCLGRRQDRSEVHDVELPPWANGDVEIFTSKMREALESDYVSENLHLWIDLIFGYKQKGEEAIKADNVFYYLTYEGAVDLDSIEDEQERSSIELQINEFGQTPKQLFRIPHPQRCSSDGRARLLSSLSSVELGPRSCPSVGKDVRKILFKHESLYETADKLSFSVDAIADMFSQSEDDLLAAEGALVRTSSVSKIVNTPSPKQLTSYSPAPISESGKNESLKGISTPPNVIWESLDKLSLCWDVNLHRNGITAVCLTYDTDSVFSVGQDSMLKFVCTERGEQQRSIGLCDLALSCLDTTADGLTVVVGSWDNHIYFYSKEYGRVLDLWSAHDDAVSCLCIRGEIMVTAGWDSTVKVWSLRCDRRTSISGTTNLISELIDHEEKVLALDVYIPNACIGGKINSMLRDARAVSGSEEGVVIVWALDDGEGSILHTLCGHNDAINDVQFTPNGEQVVTCSSDGSIRMFGIVQGTEVVHIDAGVPVCCIAVDGLHVVAGTIEGTLQVWHASTGAPIASYEDGHVGAITCLSVAHHGHRVISGGEDGKLCLWTEGILSPIYW